jgi:hypothetical protein
MPSGPTLLPYAAAAATQSQVGNYTIRLSMLNKDAKWTKALKLMLADLKVALQVGKPAVAAAAAAAACTAAQHSQQEGPYSTTRVHVQQDSQSCQQVAWAAAPGRYTAAQKEGGCSSWLCIQ